MPRSLLAVSAALMLPLASALCAFGMVAMGSARAQGDEPKPRSDTPVEFKIDAHNTVRIEHPAQAPLQVVILPGGSTQTLKDVAGDEEGNFDVGTKDFNFDGHQDLYTSAALGQVNELDTVYLFDPVARRFHKLEMVKSAATNCDGLWSLDPDVKTRTLTSSCRSGPMWYTDQYRYDAKGRLYLYRTEDVLQFGSGDALRFVDQYDVPLAVWTTYSHDGKVIEHTVGSGLKIPPEGPLKPLRAHVALDRLPLHDTPDGPATRRYLVKGDAVDLLDISADQHWLQLRFHNPAKGNIDGWVPISAEHQ